ncbi:MAG: YARHG domain-containing protein [Ignavibacteria bacterium]|nr:YARHG domain-containing protein [Ignavibacteria bacterium]
MELPHSNSEFDLSFSVNEHNASTRLLEGKELQNLYKDELELIRNLIYARHGYKFKNPYFKSVFDSVEWYIPVSEDVNKDLTDIEQKNIELIKRYESRAKKITYER